MTIEIICITVIGVLIASYVMSKNAATGAQQEEAGPTGSPAAGPAVRPTISIEGAALYKGDRSFLKSFGLPPEDIAEVKTLSGFVQLTDAPAQAQAACREFLAKGGVRGQGVAAYASGRRTLAADEAVYFALMREAESLRIVAVLDKLR